MNGDDDEYIDDVVPLIYMPVSSTPHCSSEYEHYNKHWLHTSYGFRFLVFEF